MHFIFLDSFYYTILICIDKCKRFGCAGQKCCNLECCFSSSNMTHWPFNFECWCAWRWSSWRAFLAQRWLRWATSTRWTEPSHISTASRCLARGSTSGMKWTQPTFFYSHRPLTASAWRVHPLLCVQCVEAARRHPQPGVWVGGWQQQLQGLCHDQKQPL